MTGRSRGPGMIVARLRTAGAVAALASAGVVAALGTWLVFSGVPEIRGVELNVLFTIEKHLGGLPLYTAPAAPPFDVAQYGPLYYLVVATLARALGLAAGDAATLLMLARGVSAACTVALLAVVWRIATHRFEVRPGVAACAVAFTLVALGPWGVVARPDALEALLVLAAFAVSTALALEQAEGALPPAILVALLVAAAFTKQTAAQAIGVVALQLALAGRWPLAIGVPVVAVGGIALGGAAAVATWPAFLDNVLGGVRNGVSLANAFGKTYAGFFVPFGGLVLLVGVLLARWCRTPRDASRALFLAGLPVLLGVAMLTGLKAGSAENYFAHWLVLAGLAVAVAVGERRVDDVVPVAAAALLLLVLPARAAATAHTYWWTHVDNAVSFVRPVDSLWSQAYYGPVRERLRARLAPGEPIVVLPLGLGVQLPDHVVLPQKEVAGTLLTQGVVDYAAFTAMIDDGRLRTVVRYADAPLPEDLPGRDRLATFAPVERVGVFEILARR